MIAHSRLSIIDAEEFCDPATRLIGVTTKFNQTNRIIPVAPKWKIKLVRFGGEIHLPFVVCDTLGLTEGMKLAVVAVARNEGKEFLLTHDETLGIPLIKLSKYTLGIRHSKAVNEMFIWNETLNKRPHEYTSLYGRLSLIPSVFNNQIGWQVDVSSLSIW